MQQLDLNSGRKMPTLGLGTWLMNGEALKNTVEIALDLGYRHFDTASNYGNEKALGQAFKKWLDSGKGERADLFITTKLPPFGMYTDKVLKYLQRSLHDLNLKYIDLFLIHCPFGVQESQLNVENNEDIEMDEDVDRLAVWTILEEQVQKGLIRSLGVSNFDIDQLDDLYNRSSIKPAVAQVELHLHRQQMEMVQYCKDRDINVVAYSPLASPGIKKYFECHGSKLEVPNLLDCAEVKELAKNYKKSPAQILLRYTVQRGVCVIPKATKDAQLEENMSIFDFTLTSDQMKALARLDRNIPVVGNWQPWTWVR